MFYDTRPILPAETRKLALYSGGPDETTQAKSCRKWSFDVFKEQ